MALISVTSPHAHGPASTQHVMRDVLLATLPGIAALTYFFGWGTLVNLVLAIAVALACEALVLAARGKPVSFFLSDLSAVVTAVLLACALPPAVPWWLVVVATAFAIIFGKQLYGGLGMNPFNPAMLGYALVLVSFPVAMTTWNLPGGIGGSLPSLAETVAQKFTGIALPDGVTGATPLDAFRQFHDDPARLDGMAVMHGWLAGAGWEHVNLAFLAGGLFLLMRRVISWHIPLTFLATLTAVSLFASMIDNARFASPPFHLLSGGTMLCAFFIATDPVSAATSRHGRIVFAAAIGILVWVIRTFGGYPDAIAFSVLLMNLAAPAIDYYTQPRTYGHKKPGGGIGMPKP
jgi:electron transport complex protein RnfD